MLFNPDWSKTETKADPFKLETLIAWLEKQPAGTYDYTCCKSCLLCQYFTDNGVDFLSVGPGYLRLHDYSSRDLPQSFDDVAGILSGKEGWTFGAALERARALHSDND